MSGFPFNPDPTPPVPPFEHWLAVISMAAGLGLMAYWILWMVPIELKDLRISFQKWKKDRKEKRA